MSLAGWLQGSPSIARLPARAGAAQSGSHAPHIPAVQQGEPCAEHSAATPTPEKGAYLVTASGTLVYIS